MMMKGIDIKEWLIIKTQYLGYKSMKLKKFNEVSKSMISSLKS